MTPRADKRAQARAKARKAPSSQPPWLWIGIGAVIVVVGVIAIVAGRGSKGNGSSNTTTAAGVQQTRSVEVTGSALPQMPDSGTDPGVGQAIPDLHGSTFEGTPISITKDGRAKLVLFVAHWCPHCQREVPLLSDYLHSHPLPAGVDLVTVATGTNPDLPNYPPSAWLAGQNWPAPVMADSAKDDAAQAFGLPAYPYFVAVGADGKVLARTSGEISTDRFAALAQQAASTTSGQ